MSEIKLALSKVETPTFTKPQIVEKVKNLPENIECLSSQLAGHDFAIFQDKANGVVLKPVFDIRGVREEVFYRSLFDPKHDKDPSLVKLRSFIPAYVSTQIINDVQFVTLSDLTLDVVNASLMDVKMGSITYDRDASEEKITHESTKDFLSKKFGFRILAVKKWIVDKNVYEQMGRDYCRECTAEDEKKIILFYLEQNDKAKTIELTKSIIQQLNEIRDWFNNDNIDLFEFTGSSIYFIYSFNDGKFDCRIKMIDFAHIYPIEGSKINLGEDKKDYNYLLGLDSLISVIKTVIELD